MKKISLVIGALFLLISLLPSQAKASTLNCSQVDGMAIFGYDYNEWKFIGAISSEWDSNSIANEYGAGSEYNSDSINNKYGSFGGEYSYYSAFNDYTSYAPIIVDDDYKFVGYLTVNKYNTPNINPYEAIACANNSYASSDSKMEDIIFKSIPSSGYSSSGYLPTPPISKYTCPLNSHTSLTDTTKCDCNVGFQINSLKTACVAIPTKTNNQICQDDSGINVEWDGTKNSDGHLNCNCKSGYLWNGERTACVVNNFPTGCTSNIGFSPTTGMSCDGAYKCSDGMQLNNNKTKCIPIPIVAPLKVVEPKPIIQTVATKSDVKAPAQKNWYEWLNPFSWFK